MASLADMTVTLGLDDKDFVKGINNAENSVKKFGSTSEKEITNAAKLFGTLKTALAGIAVGSLITETAKLNTDIVNTAKALNMSTAAAIAFQKATAAAGGDADNARDALISLSQKLGEASSQGGDALAAFNEMGISLKDITTNSPEQMLLKTLKAMNALSDSTQRESIRTRIFGEDFKNANLPEVIRNMEALAGKAKNLSPAYESARNAQLQFNKTFADFQDQITMAIPWETMANSLKKIADNMDLIGGSIKGILEIGAAFLFVSKIMVPLRNATAELASGFEMMGGIISWLKTHVIGGTFGPLLESIKDIGAVLFGTGPLLARFGTSLAGLFGLGSKAAVLYLIADGFNEVVKSITGVDVIGKLDELTQSVARFFGIAYQTEYHKKVRDTALKQASEEAIEAEKKRTDATEKTSKLLADQLKEIAQLHQQYQSTNDQALQKLQTDIDLIGATEEQKRKATELMNIENQRQSIVQGLQQKIAAATDPAIIKQYNDAISEVNMNFGIQKDMIDGLISKEQEKLQIQKLNQYSAQSLFEINTRINDIDQERGKVFLPLIEQKYKDIEYAAKKAYEAQLQSLANEQYGGDITKIPKEIAAEYESLGKRRMQQEKDAVKALDETNNAKKYLTSLQQIQLDQAKELSDIQQEIAYTTMPAYQQIAEKINYASKQRIDDTIKQMELERGQAFTASERAQWTETLRGKTDELIKKQQESYLVSRQWDTGWTKAMNDYIENATNAAKVAENIFSKAMSGMEDMFVNFVKTGKFQWKDFVNTMLEELLRAQFQSVFAKIFGSATGNTSGTSGSLLGGLFSSFSGLFADGGTIGAGKWGVVGEAGPEIVQGPANITPMDKITPSSNITNVNYNISAVDARSFKQMIAQDPSFIHAVAMQGAKSIPGRI